MRRVSENIEERHRHSNGKQRTAMAVYLYGAELNADVAEGDR